MQAWSAVLDRENLLSRDVVNTGNNSLRRVPSILPIRVLRPNQYRVSSGFGMRYHPITGRNRAHEGIDLPQPVGTPMYATADGFVKTVAVQPGGLGLAILIDHENGFSTTYGHLSRFFVKSGQYVRRGQRIGRVGQTGLTTGPHLHYSVQHRGQAVDPKRYCFLVLGK